LAGEGGKARDRGNVAVFGGAGAGKSTVTNILVGADVAEVNPQAGFTRRPTAMVLGTSSDARQWPDHLGILSRLDDSRSADQDADFYGINTLANGTEHASFLEQFHIWDCPDLTTKDAAHYESRAIEIAALADVAVYVASDERYNDLLPTHFLQALLDAGKPVVVALTKVSPLDADSLIDLFRTQVAEKLRRNENIHAVIAIPFPGRQRMASIWTSEFPHGDALRQAVRKAVGSLESCRNRLAVESRRYLAERQGRLLDPLRKDIGEWKAWTEQVRLCCNEAVARYEREHLNRLDYPEFHEARERLIASFAPPAPFDLPWRFLEILRWPIRWLRGKAADLSQLGSHTFSSDAALDRIRRGIIEQLQVAVSARKSRHRFWTELHAELEKFSKSKIEPHYREIRDRQRRTFGEKLRQVTGAATDLLTRQPRLAAGVQLGRLVLEIGLLIYVCYRMWQANWSIILIVLALPIVAGITDLFARWLAGAYVNRMRTQVIDHQKQDVRMVIQQSYLDQLVHLPREAGTSLQNMAGVADRLPALISGQQDGGIR
jgi:hypothetical protein